MNWTKQSPVIAKKNEGHAKYGYYCMFVPLTETLGVKFYRDPETRNAAYALHRKAFAVRLAPKLGAKCKMPAFGELYNNGMIYGYMTEIVTIGIPDKEEYEAFIANCLDRGVSTSDMNQNLNCGKTPNGSCVRFDFDPAHYSL